MATYSQWPRIGFVDQMVFEYLRGGRLDLHHSGQPVPVLSHGHSEIMSPDVQEQPPVFQCVPISSGLVTGHH